MFTNAKYVYIVEKVPKISMQGRKMFTNAKYVHIVERFPNKHAGQEDAHKR